MELWQALFLGLLQGVSELFPVSSLAQTILIPALLGWTFDQQQSQFLAFVVLLHLATALALVIYFWRDWLKVVAAFWGSLIRMELVYDRESKFAWLLVAGTVVVGAVGLVAEKKLRLFFEDRSTFWLVAIFLIANGFLMLIGDWLKQRIVDEPPPQNEPMAGRAMEIAAALTGSNMRPFAGKCAEDLSIVQGAAVGAAQTLALLPGFSRSGATIVAGLFAGLTYREASRFSFMLATPVIALAALLKVPKLLHPENRDMLNIAIPAAVVAGVSAYLSTRFLMRYFKSHRLWPFALYCIAFGGFALYMLKR